MKTEKELIKIKKQYINQMNYAKTNIQQFKGFVGEQKWTIEYHIARAKILLLKEILQEK